MQGKRHGKLHFRRGKSKERLNLFWEPNNIGSVVCIRAFKAVEYVDFQRAKCVDDRRNAPVLGISFIREKFYCGLETMQANVMFGGLVRKLMKFEPDPT